MEQNFYSPKVLGDSTVFVDTDVSDIWCNSKAIVTPTTEGLSDPIRDLTPPEVTSNGTENEQQFRCWSDKPLGHVNMGRAPRPHVDSDEKVGRLFAGVGWKPPASNRQTPSLTAYAVGGHSGELQSPLISTEADPFGELLTLRSGDRQKEVGQKQQNSLKVQSALSTRAALQGIGSIQAAKKNRRKFRRAEKPKDETEKVCPVSQSKGETKNRTATCRKTVATNSGGECTAACWHQKGRLKVE